nr:hypothetical protein Iba_chr07cCG8010 [Ipomoea batatas]
MRAVISAIGCCDHHLPLTAASNSSTEARERRRFCYCLRLKVIKPDRSFATGMSGSHGWCAPWMAAGFVSIKVLEFQKWMTSVSQFESEKSQSVDQENPKLKRKSPLPVGLSMFIGGRDSLAKGTGNRDDRAGPSIGRRIGVRVVLNCSPHVRLQNPLANERGDRSDAARR